MSEGNGGKREEKNETSLSSEVSLLRKWSREVIRELGLLQKTCVPLKLTFSQCHAQIKSASFLAPVVGRHNNSPAV